MQLIFFQRFDSWLIFRQIQISCFRKLYQWLVIEEELIKTQAIFPPKDLKIATSLKISVNFFFCLTNCNYKNNWSKFLHEMIEHKIIILWLARQPRAKHPILRKNKRVLKKLKTLKSAVSTSIRYYIEKMSMTNPEILTYYHYYYFQHAIQIQLPSKKLKTVIACL